jgi:energy-coupling factor transporter ATP-binding protein EcfA2
MQLRIDKAQIELAGHQLEEEIAQKVASEHRFTEAMADTQREGITNIVNVLGNTASLELDPSRPLLVFGENGSGKTTVSRAIALALDRSVCEAHWQKSEEDECYRGNFYKSDVRTLKPRLRRATIGLNFSRAIEVDASAEALQEFGLSHDIDFATKRVNDGIDYGALDRTNETGYTGHNTDTSSRRQQLDRFGDIASMYVTDRTRREDIYYPWIDMIDPSLKPVAIMYDEPETGLSPRRHDTLGEEILDLDLAAHVIVATNSLRLWQHYQNQDERFAYLDLSLGDS